MNLYDFYNYVYSIFNIFINMIYNELKDENQKNCYFFLYHKGGC